MKSIFSEKPCDNCNADRQIGNPYNWQRECDRCTKIGQWRNEVLKRLAEIENILGDEYELDRLKELAEADKDNRCLILPVKVGDILYYPYNNYISQLQVKYITICSRETSIIYTEIIEGLNDIETNFNSKWIGEIIFLTKEEAEKALEELKNYEN